MNKRRWTQMEAGTGEGGFNSAMNLGAVHIHCRREKRVYTRRASGEEGRGGGVKEAEVSSY